MCLILFAYKIDPVFNLVLAANRDEFYNRATLPLGFWSDREYILAGRDLKGGGTWLGVTRSGRFAAITNYRDPASLKDKAPSRGLLLSSFLSSDMPAGKFLNEISVEGSIFNGFNLVVGDADGLYYYSNRGAGVVTLSPGIYGLSNHLLDTAWPKVERGKQKLEILLREKRFIRPESLFELLHDRTTPLTEQLPDTGIGPRWEKLLSSLFIVSRNYGTRSSSVLLISPSGRISVAERTFHPHRFGFSATSTRIFHFSVNGGKSG